MKIKEIKKLKKAEKAFYNKKRMTGTYAKTVYNRLRNAWLNDVSDIKPAFTNEVKTNPKRHYYLIEETTDSNYYCYAFRIIRA